MRILLLLLLFAVSANARVVMSISANEVIFYEAYQPVQGVTNFVHTSGDNIEFTSSSVIVDMTTTIVAGASSVAVTSPPIGYFQWLYGGTESAFPSNDKIFPVPAPVVDGTNSIFQTSFIIFRNIVVSGTGTPADDLLPTYSIHNGKGVWSNGDDAGTSEVLWGYDTEPNKWALYNTDTGELFIHTNAAGAFPPKTGWSAGDDVGNPPTLTYASLWVASEEFATNTYADLSSNPQGTNGVYVKYDSSSNITEIITYPEVLSASKHAEALNYLAETFLPDMDTTGTPTTDVSWMPDAFSPPVADGGSATVGTPEISEWTRQNDSGDTMALTGEAL